MKKPRRRSVKAVKRPPRSKKKTPKKNLVGTYRDHKQKWNDCKRCELCTQRRQVVFARGTLPADILFVGEAPGASEDSLGKPFCGPAGHLLDFIITGSLTGQGYNPPTFAISNLVCCFPRDAKKSPNHQPPKAAVTACKERLNELYLLCNPKAVVAVGNLAKKWVPLSLDLEGVECVDIIHPASILRMDISQKELAVQRSIVVLRDLGSGLALPF